MLIISENEFSKTLQEKLEKFRGLYDFVTGPGRSGAIASVYASHFLGIPFVPYKSRAPGKFLIVDTAAQTGRTIRGASAWYDNADYVVFYNEPPRVRFWYERIGK